MMPIRSRGCRHCVRRKIRCDLKQPVCRRCEIANLQCDGPQQEKTFVTETPDSFSAKSALRRLKRCKRQSLETNYDSHGFDYAPETQVEPSPYSDDVYCLFYLDKMFAFGNWNDDLQSNKSWIFDALRTPSKHPASSIALRCVIEGAFGRFHGNKALQNSSSKLYGQGLKVLAQHLQDPATAHNFDVLAAVIFLLYFECLFFTDRKGWVQHSRALMHLVEQKGPGWFMERPARSLFTNIRYGLHLEALISCERSFLERPEWQTILRSPDDTIDNIYRLADIAIALPGLFEDIAKLNSVRSLAAVQTRAAELHAAFQNIFERLQAWWRSWRSDTSRLPQRTTSVPASLGVDLPPNVSHFLRFQGLEMAATVCRYHAHIILTLRGLDQTHTLASVAPALARRASHPPQNKPHAMAVTEHAYAWGPQRLKHAKAILEGLPFYCLPQYVFISGTYAGFPARAAWGEYSFWKQDAQQGKEEARWIEKFLNVVSEKSGFEMARRNIWDVDVYLP